MHSHILIEFKLPIVFVVLILVLMEDALAQDDVRVYENARIVLILVLMEDALAQIAFSI